MDLASAIERVNSFRALEKGWDSYHAEPPNEWAIAEVLRVLGIIDKRRLLWPLAISPSVEGGIGLIWRDDTIAKYAGMECSNDGEWIGTVSIPNCDLWVEKLYRQADLMARNIYQISRFRTLENG